jgi:hypothetical protein
LCPITIPKGDEIKERNLGRAAGIYNSHGKLAAELGSAAIGWNDKLATELDKTYLSMAIDTLRKLIIDDKFSRLLELTPQDILTISTTTDESGGLKLLANYFNHRSTHKDTRKKFNDLIVTDKLKFIMMMFEVFKEFQNMEKEEFNKTFSVLGPYLEILIEAGDYLAAKPIDFFS